MPAPPSDAAPVYPAPLPFPRGRIVVGHRNGKINLTFDQAKTMLLKHIQQIGTPCRDFGLHAWPGSKVGFCQGMGIVAQNARLPGRPKKVLTGGFKAPFSVHSTPHAFGINNILLMYSITRDLL